MNKNTAPRSAAVPLRHGLALSLLLAGVTGSTVPLQHAAAPVAASAPALLVAHVAPAEPRQAAAAEPAAKLEPVALAAPAQPLPDVTQLHSQLKWIKVEVNGRDLVTPDAQSRLLLARSAAARAGLQEVGLDFRDVYGVINAETTWVPRTGLGRNGVVSHGLAQFEPGTAKAVGLSNPDDAVEAVHAAARLLKEAAQWSARRIAGLDLTPEAKARKLREGVSIYYNLSSRARSTWSGLNTEQLPVETLRHIRNVFQGAQQAEKLVAGAALPLPAIPAPAPVVVARAATERVARAERPQARRAVERVAKASVPQPVGTIGWSKGGSRQEYVVYADGRVGGSSKAMAGGNYITWTRRAG